jgi:hypothetical protein
MGFSSVQNDYILVDPLLAGPDRNRDEILRTIYARSSKDKGHFAETSGVSKN